MMRSLVDDIFLVDRYPLQIITLASDQGMHPFIELPILNFRIINLKHQPQIPSSLMKPKPWDCQTSLYDRFVKRCQCIIYLLSSSILDVVKVVGLQGSSPTSSLPPQPRNVAVYNAIEVLISHGTDRSVECANLCVLGTFAARL